MTKSTDTIYRVVRLPQQLRVAIQTARDANKQTNEQFVAAAVEQHLPRITDALRKLGFGGVEGKTVSVRLPFSDESGTLPALKDASENVGIPTVQLLSLCLSASSSDKAARPTKRRHRNTKTNAIKTQRTSSKPRKRRGRSTG